MSEILSFRNGVLQPGNFTDEVVGLDIGGNITILQPASGVVNGFSMLLTDAYKFKVGCKSVSYKFDVKALFDQIKEVNTIFMLSVVSSDDDFSYESNQPFIMILINITSKTCKIYDKNNMQITAPIASRISISNVTKNKIKNGYDKIVNGQSMPNIDPSVITTITDAVNAAISGKGDEVPVDDSPNIWLWVIMVLFVLVLIVAVIVVAVYMYKKHN
jgi:hypothetical protein